MNPAKADDGFTLIETLVATLLFAAIATTIAGLSITAFATLGWNKERAHALVIADSQIEDLRSVRYEILQEGNLLTPVFRDGRLFNVVRTVALDEPEPSMAEVTVRVSWTRAGNRRHTYVARTIVTAVKR